jgi:pSer/pThr/pTyr-binding forkhead associated (FHA) protein
MIQLRILSGQMAGTTSVARHFPFIIGRAAGSDLAVVEPGVWYRHVAIQFEPGDGFYTEAQGDALVTVNGAAGKRRRLCNGDRIELGGTAIQFWLGETRQRGLHLPEWLVWAGCSLVTAAQVFLILKLR